MIQEDERNQLIIQVNEAMAAGARLAMSSLEVNIHLRNWRR